MKDCIMLGEKGKRVCEKKNTALANNIYSLYAGCHGKARMVFSYLYYSLNFKNFYCEETAMLLKEIAIEEVGHLEILGDILIGLKKDPIYVYPTPFGREFYSLHTISYSNTAQKMLLDSLALEMMSLEEYKRAIDRVDNDILKCKLNQIYLDEKRHIKALKGLVEEGSATSYG